ncbi:MAG: vWA domain-containing protein [Pseudorhodoplanes sp.]
MLRWLVVAAFAAMSPIHAAHSQAQSGRAGPSADAVLIMDASGSMWGQVGGQTKIGAARAAVRTILSTWKPDDRLGLVAYGHRAKGDCRDIEVLVPVSRFDPERIRAAVDGLDPKGKTPIADALRLAAQTLKSTEARATVVLVSDGIETCAPDPCAVAAELKKAGVGFVAHVIGFDVADPAARNQLQCIARVTGGVYLDARNASGLEQALGKAVAAAQGGRVESEAPAKPASDPYHGKNVRGIARLADGLDPIVDPALTWQLYKAAGGGKADFVNSFFGSALAEAIAPGDYVMRVEYGQVHREVPLRIERNAPALLDVVLDAGYVTSEGSIAGTGAKAEGITWEVYSAAGQWIATDYNALPRFVLPAGDYVLHLTRGTAKTQKPFALAAGDSINVALTLDAGKLLVSALYAAGGPKVEKGLVVEVHAPSASGSGRGAWIATNYEPVSQFDLPTGSYDVTVGVGEARRTVRADVKSGTATRLDVAIEAGVVGVKAASARVIEIFDAERDINNHRKLVHTSYDPVLNVALNAGSYVAVATFGADRRVEREFSISAGKRTEIEVRP